MRTLRLRQVAYVFLGVLVLILLRLAQLQLLEHEQWSDAARSSRIDRSSIPFQRGRILDRNGMVLAEDRQSYDLFFRYRDFRRGFVAAQLFECLRLLGQAPSSLVTTLDQAESLGRACLQVRPEALRDLPPSVQDDLLFYLTGMTGSREFQRRTAVQNWLDGGSRPFADAFPGAMPTFEARVSDARRHLALLEQNLGPDWQGRLLPRLEERRLQLEVMIGRATLQDAAARQLDHSSSRMRMVLSTPGEERTEILQELGALWRLPGTQAYFASLIAPLHASDLESLPQEAAAMREFDLLSIATQIQVLDALAEHVRSVAPEAVKGARRRQTYRIQKQRVIALERDLEFHLVDLLAQQAADYPGLYLQEVRQREYPVDVARMIVGSLRLPTEGDLEETRFAKDRYRELQRLLHRTPAEEAEFRSYRDWLWSESLTAEERTGQEGVEAVYEPVLRGRRGYLQELEGGAEGARPLELLFSPAEHGADVRLALDATLIDKAERVIEQVYRQTPDRLREVFPATPEKAFRQFDPALPRVGMVLLDLQDGSVPVLVSTPNVSREELQERYPELVEMRQGTPLRHRALGGGFYGWEQPFPGSTFKPLVAAAALARDPSCWNRVYECVGWLEPVGPSHRIHCDNRNGHGPVDMREALKRSCNVYFFHLGRWLGVDGLHEACRSLGFGQPTGCELSQVTRLELSANFLAEPEWLERDTLTLMRTAIGQVGLHASPLQMARLYGWLATGHLWRPRLVLEGGGASPAWPAPTPLSLSASQRERVIEALSAVVYEPGGTAYRTEFPPALGVVGKTGTAEIGKGVPTHAWFSGFFPREQPRYAFTVLCENTGLHGGQIASFILRDFLADPEVLAALGIAR